MTEWPASPHAIAFHGEQGRIPRRKRQVSIQPGMGTSLTFVRYDYYAVKIHEKKCLIEEWRALQIAD